MTPIDIFQVTKESVPRLDITTDGVSIVDSDSDSGSYLISSKASTKASNTVKEEWMAYGNRLRPGKVHLPNDYDSCSEENCYYDYNDEGNDDVMAGHRRITAATSAAVVPLFQSYPINDRYIAGPYEAVEILATKRWTYYKDHVHKVLPKYRSTRFGLQDERFLAYTLVPEIRSLRNNSVDVVVDRSMYFLRVRADGAILVGDCPYEFGQNQSDTLQRMFGRKCRVPHFERANKGVVIRCPYLPGPDHPV